MNQTRQAAPAALNDAQYERFRDLILARSGLLFGPRQRDALARGVTLCARRAECEDLDAYYRRLEARPTEDALWEDLIDAIAVGETYFFRNPAHFAALRARILPELIARHQDDRRLRLWSAGCSTGEEPYSLAILLRQLLPAPDDWHVTILATDISKQALHKARQGYFRPWSFRQTEAAIQQQYFAQRDGLFALDARVRQMVTFAYLNLAEDGYPSLTTNTHALDLILCRNVAIYLPETVIQKMADRFYRALRPGGWLVVGGAETSQDVYGRFATHNMPGATIYQRPAREPAPAEKVAPPVEELLPAWISEPPATTEATGPDWQTPPPTLPAVEPAPPRPVADLCEEGQSLLAAGRTGQAIAVLAQCVARQPDMPAPYYFMARAYANQGHLEQAETWCQRALERDPLRTEAHYTLALIREEQGDVTGAIGQHRKALYLDPDFVLAHYSLAHLYRQAARPRPAARHQAQALRLAVRMPADQVLPGSDGLRAAELLSMLRTQAA